ncbi:hypothetical protein Hanom_Chr16g01513421 [Helianthus anomalus]
MRGIEIQWILASLLFSDYKARYTLRCRKTIKLNEEPNTIKIHASAHCLVVNFKRRIRSHYVK